MNSEIELQVTESEFKKEIEKSETYNENILEWNFKIAKFININL